MLITYITLGVAFTSPAFGSYVSWRLHRIGVHVAEVSDKVATVHTLVDGQHDALQALADERGVTIGKQDVKIAVMEEKINGNA